MSDSRIDGEIESPHRSNKNTKRWCKGKYGREHEWEILLEAYRFGVRPLRRPCAWRITFVRNDMTTPYVSWSCRHVRKCVNCGKTQQLVSGCPDLHDRPSGPVAEWPCAECGHAVGAPHGTRLEPCVDGCECRRFWLYPKGEAER